jgi:ABC-type amino acid transport substrate-binding protein
MIRLFLAAILALSATCGGVRADDDTALTGTLKTINARGTILIGYRTTSLPFSFQNKAASRLVSRSTSATASPRTWRLRFIGT